MKPGSGEGKMEISGADSAWHLVNSSWSQRVGKWQSDKEESFFSESERTGSLETLASCWRHIRKWLNKRVMQRERENKNQGWEMGNVLLTFCFPLKNIEEKYTDSQRGYQTTLLYGKSVSLFLFQYCYGSSAIPSGVSSQSPGSPSLPASAPASPQSPSAAPSGRPVERRCKTQGFQTAIKSV